VDTILLGYPSPPIFLIELIDELGVARYSVVDGKQRLLTIFGFMNNEFPVGAKSQIENLRGLYYEGLPRDKRADFVRCRFSVEYLPSESETEIADIFDRLNRNVKKLTPQELRHARFDGVFIGVAENLSEWLDAQFSKQFPRFTDSSRRQMKDVELTSSLLLYLEEGVKSYSKDDLDRAFADRDETWENSAEIQQEFQQVVGFIKDMASNPDAASIVQSRLRNQADFYSLFAAIADLKRDGNLPEPAVAGSRISQFLETLESETRPRRVLEYLEAARAASNDSGPRRTRIDVIKDVLLGHTLVNGNGSPRA
jgi:hypothetical protein